MVAYNVRTESRSQKKKVLLQDGAKTGGGGLKVAVQGDPANHINY